MKQEKQNQLAIKLSKGVTSRRTKDEHHGGTG